MICTECGEDKPLTEFHRHTGDRRRPQCKPCRSSLRKANYDPTKSREQSLKFLYGISIDEYKSIESKQGGRCAICHLIPESRLFVDHDHITGLVRGLLCNNCNMGLGHFKDDAARLITAAKYMVTPIHRRTLIIDRQVGSDLRLCVLPE